MKKDRSPPSRRPRSAVNRPRIDAADDDDDEQQAPEALAERVQRVGPARLRHARIVVAAWRGYQVTTPASSSARCRATRPATNSCADRGVGGDRVDDLRDRRQHQDAERARDGDDAGAEAHRIAVPHHLRQHDRRRSRRPSRRSSRRPARTCAQATMPARPRPPCQWPISDTAKSIIRRATPPCVRKVPARMKNGIAMISKLSRPVNSFSDTDSIGTSVRMNMKVSTVRPSAIETGMPVSMNAISSTNSDERAPALRQLDDAGLVREADRQDQDRQQDQDQRQRLEPALAHRRRAHRRRRMQVSVASTPSTCASSVMRQFAGPVEPPRDLEEAEAHQAGAERDRQIDDPHRHFEIVRLLAGRRTSGATKVAPNTAMIAGEQRAAQRSRTGSPACASFGGSILTSTSTPTWMPVRTP